MCIVVHLSRMDCVRALNEFILELVPLAALNLENNKHTTSIIQPKLIILGQPREKLVIYSRIQDSMTKEQDNNKLTSIML